MPDGSPSGIEILPFAVPGKGAWYLEGKAHPAGDGGAGDTLGLRIGEKASGKYFYFLAACAEMTDDLKSRLAGAPLIFFDGTVWRDDELIALASATRPGKAWDISPCRAMPARSTPGRTSISAEKCFCISTIPTRRWLHDSAERKIAERAGWQIPADGTEITL